MDNFEELVAENRNMISSIYPEWTDYNYHDPGITLVELCAWLKEIQQFHMDQIGENHQRKYLKLLGVEPLYKAAAKALAEVKAEENCVLLKGTRLYADEICFETQEKEVLIGENITGCITETEGQPICIDQSQLCFNGRLRCYPFGENADSGHVFYIQCNRPFPINERIHLSVAIYNEYPVRRNLVTGQEMYPLAVLAYEYYSSEGWKSCTGVKDETCQLIQSGRIGFSLRESMKETEFFGRFGYYMRIRLVKSDYEVAPLITGISLNQVKVIQRESFSLYADIPILWSGEETGRVSVDLSLAKDGMEELFYQYGDTFVPVKNYSREDEIKIEKTVYVIEKPEGKLPHSLRVVCFTENFAERRNLAFGNGFPSQCYDLKDRDVSYEEFELMVEDVGVPGVFKQWLKVSDFDCSLSVDCHYCFDEEAGEVVFGNSIHGMAPEGKILIIGYAVSLGARGNVKAGKIKACEVEVLSNKICNDTDAWGGRDTESISNSFFRARLMLKNTERAITEQDYEWLVYQVPGLMIHSCKAFVLPEDNAVGILAVPFSVKEPKKLSEAYQNNIMSYLDSRRLLGTKVIIYSPEYIELSVYAEVKVKSYFHEAKEMIEKHLTNYLKMQEMEFGRTILYGNLYGQMDSLPYISQICSLRIEVKGNRTKKNQNGDVIPPANGVFLIKNVDCTVISVS